MYILQYLDHEFEAFDFSVVIQLSDETENEQMQDWGMTNRRMQVKALLKGEFILGVVLASPFLRRLL